LGQWRWATILSFGEAAVSLRGSFGEGLLARMMKDDAKARAAFSKARVEQEKVMQAKPDYAPAICVVGLIDPELGSGIGNWGQVKFASAAKESHIRFAVPQCAAKH
jgi:hypothetical protein